MPGDLSAGAHPQDIVDPLEFPLLNVLSNSHSLLFPKMQPNSVNDGVCKRHIAEQGLVVAHIGSDEEQSVGFIALGVGDVHASAFGNRVKSVAILETLSHDELSPHTRLTVVGAAVTTLGLDGSHVRLFTPLISRSRLSDAFLRIDTDVIGGDLKFNSAKPVRGRLESIDDFLSRSIG